MLPKFRANATRALGSSSRNTSLDQQVFTNHESRPPFLRNTTRQLLLTSQASKALHLSSAPFKSLKSRILKGTHRVLQTRIVHFNQRRHHGIYLHKKTTTTMPSISVHSLLLLLILCYFEVSRHHNKVQSDLQTPWRSNMNDNDVNSAICNIGDTYGSCFNDVRFFQCTTDGPLPRPCPAGQYFFCTGEGNGECDSKRNHEASGKGKECRMVCDESAGLDGELGRCVCD